MKDETREILRLAGMRATAPRVRIYEFLQTRPLPMSAKDIALRLGRPRIDLVTVYRTLESFAHAEMVRRVDVGRAEALYEFEDRAHHHHHLVCKECGVIEDVDVCGVGSLEAKVARSSERFASVLSHSLEFFGVCTRCTRA